MAVVDLESLGELVDHLVDLAAVAPPKREEPGLAVEPRAHHRDVVLRRLGRRDDPEERFGEARQLVGVVTRAREIRREVGPLAADGAGKHSARHLG